VGDLELLGLGLRPFGDDVAGADEFNVRAFRQVRQVRVRDAAATDHAHPNPRAVGFRRANPAAKAQGGAGSQTLPEEGTSVDVGFIHFSSPIEEYSARSLSRGSGGRGEPL